VGRALGVSGALLQTLFRNPMADPYILGVSSGSVLAIGVALLAAPLLGITPSSIPSLYTAAFLGALAVTLLMTSVSGIVRSVTTVLVVGVMLGYLSYAATSILAVLADIERIRAFTYWVFGSFSGSRWSLLTPAIPALAASLTLTALLAKQLNALLLGEEYARSMGMHIGAVRVLAVAAAAFPVSVVTTVAGPIGFIGLSAPYLARQLTQTSDHYTTIPFSALVGALLTTSADLAARMLLRPVELPVTAVTALFGSPLIIYLLLKGRGCLLLIRAEDVAAEYRGQPVLEDVGLYIRDGEFTAVVGPNASGKTTLLKTLAGLLKPLKGVVYVDGRRVSEMDVGELARSVGVVLTENVRPGLLTVQEVVALGRYPYTGLTGRLRPVDRAEVLAALGDVGIQHLADKPYNILSDGQRQKVMVARALAQKPQALILDEPVTYLDPKARVELLLTLRRICRQRKIAVIASLHEIELALRVADRLLVVAAGRVKAYGSPEEFVEDGGPRGALRVRGGRGVLRGDADG
jgi:iron complex transport system permease protein